MVIWKNQLGEFYLGDCIPGDSEASPEECAAFCKGCDEACKKADIQKQISDIEATFNSTLTMRAILGDEAAKQDISDRLSNINALQAQL